MEDEEFWSAIDNLHELVPSEVDKLEDDVLICECFCVSVYEIRQCLNDSHTLDVTKLTQELNMGKSCGACLKNSASWIDKIL